MWKAAWFVMVLSLVGFRAAQSAVQTATAEPPVSPPDTSAISRVRSTDVRITALIARAAEQSATFRSLLETIDATDGIVYVETGGCAGVRACLTLKVTIAEPHRILWIVVDPRRAACDVMVSVGHELWHAVELLREPSIRSEGALYFFLTKGGSHNPARWVETKAAIKVEEDVRSELRECD
jgi:hypothetical protein